MRDVDRRLMRSQFVQVKGNVPMEKNAKRTGIIVKIHYSRGHGRDHSSGQARVATPGRSDRVARTRLSIVIKATEKGRTEDQ
jgi:hypothetical protein